MMRGLGIHTILVLLFFGTIGCENNFNPLNEEKGTYSVYGYLDIKEGENYVRVKNMNKPFDQDTTDFNAEVIFENLEDGTTETLQDTIVVFDGVRTHNFRITTDLQFDTKYQLAVIPENGQRKITAGATTPQKAEVNIKPEFEDCITLRTLSLAPVPSKFALDVYIGFRYRGKQIWVQSNYRLEDTSEGALMEFAPRNILGEHFAPRRVGCDELSSDLFYIRYTHYGPDLFDDTISDSLNIPGGAGRFGALYRNTISFRIDTSDS